MKLARTRTNKNHKTNTSILCYFRRLFLLLAAFYLYSIYFMYNIGKLFSEKKIQLIVNYKMALFKLYRAFFVIVVVAEFINLFNIKVASNDSPSN